MVVVLVVEGEIEVVVDNVVVVVTEGTVVVADVTTLPFSTQLFAAGTMPAPAIRTRGNRTADNCAVDFFRNDHTAVPANRQMHANNKKV